MCCSAIVVDDLFHQGQGRRIIVVGDCAGNGLAKLQRKLVTILGAADATPTARRIAGGYRALRERIGADFEACFNAFMFIYAGIKRSPGGHNSGCTRFETSLNESSND